MSSNMMKSILKGLRYISQVFESSAKEEKIEIGNPTDVKHVAHIGWDGPSANAAPAPTWMNEFKSGQGGGEDHSNDLPNLPKSTRKSASPSKERSSDKTKRRSKTKQKGLSEIPDIPKKSKRKKKTRDGGGSSVSTLPSDSDTMSDFMSETGSVRSMPQFDNRDDF